MTTNADDETPDRRRLWWLVGLAGLLAVPLLVIWWPGCRQYPTVTSKESMELIQLLYSACNTKDQARLAKVELGIEKAIREGKLSPAEQEAFVTIIAMAKDGKWEKAEEASFKFAQDQVGRGHSDPDKGQHHDGHRHDKKGKATKGKSN